jgi:hypothetical protein
MVLVEEPHAVKASARVRAPASAMAPSNVELLRPFSGILVKEDAARVQTFPHIILGPCIWVS